MTDDRLSAEGVKKLLAVDSIYSAVEVYDTIDSTSSLLKRRAGELESGTVVIAGNQTAGRGRRGRSFFSPEGTGVYMSVLLRPDIAAADSIMITTGAAVAVCRAIERNIGARASIKWVNDILVDNKKACGILTEAVFTPGSSALDCAVLGIGINVYRPVGGFPEEISRIAGALTEQRREGLRTDIAAAVLNEFSVIYSGICTGRCIHSSEYKQRSLALGREVTVLSARGSYPAFVEDIDERCRLAVIRTNGTHELLDSGEISIKL